MKISIGEKKFPFVFGCHNREATVQRLLLMADPFFGADCEKSPAQLG